MSDWINILGLLGLGAVITELARGVMSMFMHKRQWSDEIKKTVIMKKLQVSEDAMANLQSIVDELMQLKLICQVENDIPTAYIEWCRNIEERTKTLYSETQSKLNRLVVYYDLSAIDRKHKIYQVMERFNKHVAEMAIYSQHVLTPEGTSKPIRVITGGAGEIESILKNLSEDVDSMISYAEDIQSVIRKDIGGYSK